MNQDTLTSIAAVALCLFAPIALVIFGILGRGIFIAKGYSGSLGFVLGAVGGVIGLVIALILPKATQPTAPPSVAPKPLVSVTSPPNTSDTKNSVSMANIPLPSTPMAKSALSKAIELPYGCPLCKDGRPIKGNIPFSCKVNHDFGKLIFKSLEAESVGWVLEGEVHSYGSISACPHCGTKFSYYYISYGWGSREYKCYKCGFHEYERVDD